MSTVTYDNTVKTVPKMFGITNKLREEEEKEEQLTNPSRQLRPAGHVSELAV